MSVEASSAQQSRRTFEDAARERITRATNEVLESVANASASVGLPTAAVGANASAARPTASAGESAAASSAAAAVLELLPYLACYAGESCTITLSPPAAPAVASIGIVVAGAGCAGSSPVLTTGLSACAATVLSSAGAASPPRWELGFVRASIEPTNLTLCASTTSSCDGPLATLGIEHRDWAYAIGQTAEEFYGDVTRPGADASDRPDPRPPTPASDGFSLSLNFRLPPDRSARALHPACAPACAARGCQRRPSQMARLRRRSDGAEIRWRGSGADGVAPAPRRACECPSH